MLENTTPISDKSDKKIVDKITKEVDSTNKAAKDKLKDIIAAKDNTGIPLLHLDISQVSKSFYAESMFKYKDLSVMAGYSSKFNINGKSIEIKNTAIISGYEEVKQYLRIPLTMKYDIKDGILTIDSDHLKADGISVKASKEDGRTIYTVAAQD
ncbi:hypothetical protein [Treponema putidum]|uniref:hypothetical protein n=1 Tax=Treponema putidum TaxID=221027 RepID=UPI002106F45B|nr:hypothetical protein [Treponema putidum]